MLRINFKQSKGITLIALVITIIVLLILAGVSIAMLTGENGILTQAQKAKKETTSKGLKEEVEILMQGDYIDSYTGKQNELKDILENVSGNKVIENIKDFNDVYYVSRDGETVTVWDDGIVEEGRMVWDGGIADDFSEMNENDKIINITSCEELKLLANKVNSGEKYNDYEINITKNLDMGARPNDTSWDNEENSNVNWISIGNTLENQLECKEINGNNKIIRGLYSKTEEKYTGLFGNVSCEVKNFIVKDSYIEGATGVAAIVGTLRGGSIDNCKNINTTVVLIEGDYQAPAGIVGQAVDNSIITNCENSGNIIAKGKRISGDECAAGGIIGLAMNNITITNCKNYGTIEGTGEVMGGIVGYINSNFNIQNCTNEGKVKGEGNIAGILGYVTESGNNIIKNCQNSGEISGRNGVAGIISTTNNTSIEKCCNTNLINVSGENSGGIVSELKENSVINNCYNIGKISGRTTVGGIAGYVYSNSTIKNSYNIGKIVGDGILGGIAGTVLEGGIIENIFMLDTCCDNTIGNNSSSNSEIKIISADEFKSNDIIQLLGSDVWQLGNNGYPVFK